MIPGCPNATEKNWRLTSEPTDEYNCFAHALYDTKHWIWPDPDGKYSWPVDWGREDSVECIVNFLLSVGYGDCSDHLLEQGWLKIAIYTLDGKPEHLARQTKDAKWSSKMATGIDIEHDDLWVLAGGRLGKPTKFMKIEEGRKPVLPPLRPPPSKFITISGGPLFT